jgi:hypothetical protein
MTTKISTSNLQTDAVQLLDAIATTANTAANVATLTYESANAASNLASSVTASVTIYATPDLLPLSGVSAGSQAFVTSTNRLYIWSGTGWYSIALINTAPSITSGGDASYTFATDGTPIVITLEASDPEGIPITWSYAVTTGSLGSTASVSQADNVFTITPSTNTEDAGEFSITFTASDGVNLATSVSAFTLAFGPDWSNTTETKVVSSDVATSDNFGYDVSISGDYAIVGAQYEDPNGIDAAGSAYIFTRSGGTWTQQAKLIASDASAGDNFGWSVDIDGDTAIVGAYADTNDIQFEGAAYIFTRSGTTWTQQARLQASDVAQYDIFGLAVAIDGDTAVVGAFNNDTGGDNAGAVYVFTRSGTTWTQQAKLQSSPVEAGARFGQSVAIENGTIVVGADRDSTGGLYRGAIFIFTGSGSSWTQQNKIQASDAANTMYLGFRSGISGNTIITGAHGLNTGSGSAYFYTAS